jgi:hypothetical protein
MDGADENDNVGVLLSDTVDISAGPGRRASARVRAVPLPRDYGAILA